MIFDDSKVKEVVKNFCESQSWCTWNKFSKNPYARWDCSYYSADTQGNKISVIAEIKYKDKYASTFTDDWLLQCTKYEALEGVKKQVEEKDPTQQYSIQYINVFCDGRIYIWNVDNISSRKDICYLDLPTTTYGSNPQRKLIPIYYCNKNETLINSSIDLLKNKV